MLGLGALLVLEGWATAGVMIASSILLGRALQPIETIVGQASKSGSVVSRWSASPFGSTV